MLTFSASILRLELSLQSFFKEEVMLSVVSDDASFVDLSFKTL